MSLHLRLSLGGQNPPMVPHCQKQMTGPKETLQLAAMRVSQSLAAGGPRGTKCPIEG